MFLNEGVRDFEARWIGWAGVNVPDEAGQKALTRALAEKVQSLSLPKVNFFMFLGCFVGRLYVIEDYTVNILLMLLSWSCLLPTL